jgi:hypothetical protein
MFKELTAADIREVLKEFPPDWSTSGKGSVESGSGLSILDVIPDHAGLIAAVLMLPALLAEHLAGMTMTNGFTHADKSEFAKRGKLRVEPEEAKWTPNK